ncbi:MAG TPA: 5-deoxy-glucuronate isomerase [Chthoniobacterales bacterium]
MSAPQHETEPSGHGVETAGETEQTTGKAGVVRHHRSKSDGPFLLDVRPERARWKYLSFKVARLAPGQTIKANTGEEEVVFVPLSGRGKLSFHGEAHELTRQDLFREVPSIAYLPPHTAFTVEAIEPFEMAMGGAPAAGHRPARIIQPAEIATAVRGDANAARGVSTLADADELTERLTVYEIHTPSGHWSSFPPHRHDTRDGSSYHEETYYYRFLPEDGFALQRIYTRDTDLDVAVPVRHGDVVLIHEGYHPVVKAPGTNAYYLNFLAGDVRKINAVTDPHYEWVSKNWEGNPIAIPLKS